MKLHRTLMISAFNTGMGLFKVGLWLFFAPSFCSGVARTFRNMSWARNILARKQSLKLLLEL